VSRAENVYHCCAHKTGSQWLRAIFEDTRTLRYSGLSAYNYQSEQRGGFDDRKITERQFSEPFPLRKIVTPLYLDYSSYAGIPKPAEYRTFFVMRDPRDMTVSWYFSMKLSHGLMGNLGDVKKTLDKLDEPAGLCFVIDHLRDFGAYAALASWIDAAQNDTNTLLVRFEELTGEDNIRVVRRLFDHLDIGMPDEILRHLLADYSFERLSGRKKGQEDQRSHYRKGEPGDWENHFDHTVQARFESVTGDLTTRMGYGEG
jgi:hypothetical protein